jgi:hypothetical protein
LTITGKPSISEGRRSRCTDFLPAEHDFVKDIHYYISKGAPDHSDAPLFCKIFMIDVFQEKVLANRPEKICSVKAGTLGTKNT